MTNAIFALQEIEESCDPIARACGNVFRVLLWKRFADLNGYEAGPFCVGAEHWPPREWLGHFVEFRQALVCQPYEHVGAHKMLPEVLSRVSPRLRFWTPPVATASLHNPGRSGTVFLVFTPLRASEPKWLPDQITFCEAGGAQ